jgi:CheY-like chemotaxis protein
LSEVLRQAIETSRPVIDDARHVLAVDAPREALVVDADPTRLTQVFANLLNNAAKFTLRGGRIDVRVEREGDRAVVRVRDTGVGIDPAMLSSVFEMFVQGDVSAERERSGLGIGLSLVSGLVAMHGGTVEAHSEGRGKGSEFVVRLPLAGAPPVRDAVVGEVVPSAAGRRILVVDDNRDAAASLAIMLRAAGEDARSAYDAVEALAIGAAFRPEAVILDLGMPRVSGLEGARRIRHEAWGKHVKLIALTGWGQEADRRRTEAAGFIAHLVKPADPGEIARVLSAVLPATSAEDLS